MRFARSRRATRFNHITHMQVSWALTWELAVQPALWAGGEEDNSQRTRQACTRWSLQSTDKTRTFMNQMFFPTWWLMYFHPELDDDSPVLKLYPSSKSSAESLTVRSPGLGNWFAEPCLVSLVLSEQRAESADLSLKYGAIQMKTVLGGAAASSCRGTPFARCCKKVHALQRRPLIRYVCFFHSD